MTHSRRSFLLRAALLAPGAASLLAIPQVHAEQSYPHRPVRFIVPYPPGAATDTLGRMAAEVYAQAWQQPFVVENRGGGGTTIGTRAIATAAPDGYTIGIVDTAFTINPGLLGERLPYDTLADFTPIGLIASAPFVMVVHPSVPARNLAELIALAKTQPAALSYGSAGVGSGPHLAGEQLRQQAHIEILHVPYRGGGTVFTDLLGGQVQCAFATVPSLVEHVRAGRLRALAVTSAQRVASLPDVPTFREAGLPGVDIMPLFGVVGPARLPTQVTERLAGELEKALKSGALREKLIQLGFVPIGAGPAAFGERIRTDVEKWSALIKAGGIRAE